MKKYKCPECHGAGEMTILGSLCTWVINTMFIGTMMLCIFICLAKGLGCTSAHLEIHTIESQENNERDRTDSGQSGIGE